MNPKEFGDYLRSLRKDANLTMRRLDALSGVSHSYISQLERGERGVPSPEILKKMAGPLGVPYGELMYYAGYLSNETELSEQEREGLEFQLVHLPNGKVLRGEEANAYLRSQGALPTSIEEAENAHKNANKLEMLSFLEKEITFFGYRLSKDERKRIQEMLELMFPHYVPKE